jgi:hypothetical protein
MRASPQAVMPVRPDQASSLTGLPDGEETIHTSFSGH